MTHNEQVLLQVGYFTVITKIFRFNDVLIFLPARSKELPHHNQMFLFLRV